MDADDLLLASGSSAHLPPYCIKKYVPFLCALKFNITFLKNILYNTKRIIKFMTNELCIHDKKTRISSLLMVFRTQINLYIHYERQRSILRWLQFREGVIYWLVLHIPIVKRCRYVRRPGTSSQLRLRYVSSCLQVSPQINYGSPKLDLMTKNLENISLGARYR